MPNITDEQLSEDQEACDEAIRSEPGAFEALAAVRWPAYIAEVRRLRDAISNGRELKRCLRDYLEFCADNHDEPLDINTVDGFLNRIEPVACAAFADTQDMNDDR